MHGVLVPHLQLPPAQVLAAMASQAVHAPPEAPHWARVTGLTQLVPAQHPEAQLPTSQTQLVPLHRCPAPQAAPPPHWQVPAAEQALALVESQEAHALPEAPQFASVGGETQAVPRQQPAGQVAPSHTHCPPTQCSPPVQAGPVPHAQPPATQALAANESQPLQEPPLVPHWASVGDETQVVPTQQPPAQLVPSHTQC